MSQVKTSNPSKYFALILTTILLLISILPVIRDISILSLMIVLLISVISEVVCCRLLLFVVSIKFVD